MIKQALYFAYGSNLNRNQMLQRCPRARFFGPATLVGYRLTFPEGIANVEQGSTNIVEGGLWTISNECLQALDRYEGFPKLYLRKWVTVTLQDGTLRQALIYVRSARRPLEPPSARYLGSIVRGYRDFKLSSNATSQLLQSVLDAELELERRQKSWIGYTL